MQCKSQTRLSNLNGTINSDLITNPQSGNYSFKVFIIKAKVVRIDDSRLNNDPCN